MESSASLKAFSRDQSKLFEYTYYGNGFQPGNGTGGGAVFGNRQMLSTLFSILKASFFDDKDVVDDNSGLLQLSPPGSDEKHVIALPAVGTDK